MSEMNGMKTYGIDKLLAEIITRREDRGFLAELRRGLSPATEDQAWPHVVHHAAGSFTDETKRRIWVTVGALAATLVPDGILRTEGYAPSIASVMCRIATDGYAKKDEGITNYGPKFRRILNSPDAIDLCDLVAGVGRNAARKGFALNCRALFWDLWNWEDAEKREKIRVRWARDFYGVFEKAENEGTSEGINE